MLSDVAALLRCPVCGDGVRLEGIVLRCPVGHSFDQARQGYVNLLPGGASAGTADTAEMVAARREVLSAGHFAGLAELIAECVDAAVPGPVLDAGAGTGYYLAEILDRAPDRVGLALDVSKYALRCAARAHPRIGAIGWDTWRPLPVGSATMAAVLNVFAPRNGAQFARVLRPDGVLVVAAPAADHLTELVTQLGLLSVDVRKADRVREALGAHFAPVARRVWRCRRELSRAEVAAVVGMGPSARHLPAGRLAELVGRLPEATTAGFAVEVTVHRPTGSGNDDGRAGNPPGRPGEAG